MPDLDVFLSNPGHHVASLAPVVDFVANRGISSRILSFCELRGFQSPLGAFRSSGTAVLPIWPAWLRRRPGASRRGPTLGPGRRRRVLEELVWETILGPRIERHLGAASRLAVLPNDSAFPFDRVAALLHRRGMPFVLVQEGIRFPLPAERSSRYGLGGAKALAVWGEASADYFRSLGVEAERIHVTGSPRFDDEQVASSRVEPRELKGPVALLLITNPIDLQGFCQPEEKSRLVARLVLHLRESLADRRMTLTIRPHPGESALQYSDALAPEQRELVSFDAGGELSSALAASDVAIVMASTVGLEALRQGLPLAVLPVPGHGFVHDYVEREAALGIDLDESVEAQLIQLAASAVDRRPAAEAYLEYHLSRSRQATQNVGQLIIDLLDDE